MRVVFVILAVTLWGIVAFLVGVACGQDLGRRAALKAAHDLCMDWARLALHGHEKWRALTPATALRRAAGLLCPERRS